MSEHTSQVYTNHTKTILLTFNWGTIA